MKRLKKSLILAVIMGMLSVNTYAGSQTAIYINGKVVATSVAPVKDASGSMLVPLKFIANELGATVKYDQKQKSI